MHRLIDSIGGLYELLRLGFQTRFKFKGPYWQWRLHTAFGTKGPPSKSAAIAAALRYGRWIHRIRKAR